ncbi:MAG TPA: tungsten formylmethanofuran dehydrogenase [Pseudolabrys sp.]|jgi:formylmethanofuran dehydrogenase subunit B|nr:tungsten formylmethanofuran dehydrogenase [Pseudolabrys sp.]
MAEAWIRGSATELDSAIAEAAKLLAESRMPVIAGLGTDVAGARAAIALARRIGGIVDHMHSAALLRDLDVMREAGMMVTTPNETRLRADPLLLVGPGLVHAWPELPERLLGDRKRRVIWLCPGDAIAEARVFPDIVIVGRDTAELPILLAALRARCAGRPVAKTPIAAHEIDALADDLVKARFGVAVWSAAAHDELTIEMLCGLVKDLNDNTRFSGLPLAPPDNAAGVQQVSGWMTGFPMRAGFARGYWEHDPWRFDATRLVDSGEADCALWISAYGAHAPVWTRKLPLIALGADPDRKRSEVAIAVGLPRIDHAAVEYRTATATLGAVEARQPTNRISVADVVTRISEAIPDAAPC